MSAGFTPGPWSAVIPTSLDDNLPFVLTSDGGAPLEPETLQRPDECVANARLIAAAPALYEALERILALDISLGGHIRAESLAALKQARGEA